MKTNVGFTSNDLSFFGELAGIQAGPARGRTFTTQTLTWTDMMGNQSMAVSPYENYTASNITPGKSSYHVLENFAGSFVENQIHELANSIAYITGKDIGNDKDNIDQDSGRKLSLCVEGKLTGGK